MQHHTFPRRRGVTLLEILLAMSLLVTLTSMTYWFYSSSMETNQKGTMEADKLRLARVVLDRITTEIRQASSTTAEDRMGIRGEKESIAISTLRVPTKELSKKRSSRDEPPPAEFDLVAVQYKIARHPDILHEDGYEMPLGLARVEVLIPRAESPGSAITAATQQPAEGSTDGAAAPPEEVFLDELFSEDGTGDKDVSLGPDINWEELYAPEIRFLRFCYYDGYKWWDDWQVAGENPLPQLVQITIGFESHPPCGEEFGQDKTNEEFCECLNKDPVDCEPLPKDQFSTIVRVTGADPLFRSRVSRESQSVIDQMATSKADDKGEEP
jgi:prepilin-type N-terminal cleavage/methylation domain-containing protein